jgi:tetratricopeptide (TPR) repeat protein
MVPIPASTPPPRRAPSADRPARRLGGVWLSALLLAGAPGVGLAASRAHQAEDTVHRFAFEFRPADLDGSLEDFLKFVQQTAPGIDGLRAQFLVAEIYFENGKYAEASEIYQRLAGLALDNDFFNVSVLQRLADCHMHLGRFVQASQSYTAAANSNVKALVPEALLGQALALLAQGDKDAAFLRFQELVAFHPTYKTRQDLMLPMGLILWENQQYAEALEYFFRDEKNPACLYFAGLCQRSAGKPPEAMATFKRVAREHPKTPWAVRAKFELGETFYQQKDFPLSFDNFAELAQDHPRDMWSTLAAYRLACNDVNRKRYKEAESRLWPLQKKERAHALHGNVTYLLTEALAEQSKVKDVVDLLQAETKGKSRSADSSFRLIWAYTAVGRYEDAVKSSNDFLRTQTDPELVPKALLCQGYALDQLERYPESAASYQLVVESYPDTAYAARALHMLAMAYFRSKQFVPIITQVNLQWNVLPPAAQRRHPETLFWIAEAHLQRKNGKEAREYYRKFVDVAPPDHSLVPQALLGQAVSYAVDKDFPTAITMLQRTYQGAQEKNDKALTAAAMLEMGNVFFNAKDYENAAASYRSFRGIDPKHEQMPFALYQEGLALYRAEYYSDAVAAWGKIAKEHPKSAQAPEARFRKAKTQFDLGQYAEAVKDYEGLVKAHPRSEFVKDARLQVGQCYYNAGDFAKAITAYGAFLKLYPDDEQAPSVLQQLHTAYYQAKKSPEEIEKLTKDQPKSPILADIYWEEGAKLYNEKDYEKSRHYFEKILSEFPGSSLSPQAAFYRAESLYLQERYAEAVPAYDNFVKYYPQDAQRGLALFHLAVSLFNLNEFVRSAESFQTFSRDFVEDAQAQNAALNVALCYAKALDVDKAVAAYRDYLKRYPDAQDAGSVYLQIGQILEKFAREKEAIQAYRQTPADKPEHPESLFNAARASRTINDEAGEAQAYEQLRDYPDKANPFRTAGLLQLAEIHLTRAEFGKAAEVYQDVAANAADDASKSLAQERLKALGSGGQAQ